MTTLLDIREDIQRFYGRFGFILPPAVKFVLAFLAMSLINSRLGYVDRVKSLPVVLIVALLSALIPPNAICAMLALIVLYELYDLSLIAALAGLALFLVIFLLYFRFAPEQGILVLLMPIAFRMGLQYTIPIAAGLLCPPASALAIAVGTVIYRFLLFIGANEQVIGQFTTEEAAQAFRYIVDGFIGDKALPVLIIAFAVAVLAVYVIRRMQIAYAWIIAVVAGAVAQLIALFVGDMVRDTKLSIGGAVLGTIIAVIVAMVIVYLFFNMDYSRIESVQFEDDDYYYYVKAVPKVAARSGRTKSRTVKRINTSRAQEPDYGNYESYYDNNVTDEEFASYEEVGSYEAEPSEEYYDEETGYWDEVPEEE